MFLLLFQLKHSYVQEILLNEVNVYFIYLHYRASFVQFEGLKRDDMLLDASSKWSWPVSLENQPSKWFAHGLEKKSVSNLAKFSPLNQSQVDH